MSKTILFCHPGGEHMPLKNTDLFPWNAGKHRRKFMLVSATVAERRGESYLPGVTREVGLWGEWEPPSCAGRFAAPGEPMSPQAWHRPLFEATDNPPPCAQNTDPWIFGERMRYAICRQKKHRVLRTLGRGDLMLFGSLKKRRADGHPAPEFNFFLDTVFVVGSTQRYGPPAPRHDVKLTSVDDLNVDNLYRRVTLERIRGQIPDCGLVLYEGATLEDPVSGMFSFVPCKRIEGDDASARFARPMINDLWDTRLGNPQLTHKVIDGIEASDAWAAVAGRCRSRGLEMAIRVRADSSGQHNATGRGQRRRSHRHAPRARWLPPRRAPC